MKKIQVILCCLLINIIAIYSSEEEIRLFEIINLDYKGLEEVKQLCKEGKDKEALQALLIYYRNKKDVSHPDIDLKNVRISKTEQKWADEGMEHKFFVHQAYQPSYFYGENIDWQYWPIKDNELRWQLHRTKWWLPMAKMYYLTKDEKYAKEWIYQYKDWIEKNPFISKNYNNDDPNENVDSIDNVRFAWRPLEVSHRVQDQAIMFLLFLNSPNFTPEFLSQFLINYDKHAKHLINNYSKEGNHLLFEAQRLLYAGSCFPEFKDADKWRKSGIDILKREMKKQIYDDGVQYELDLSYHLASINIFAKAARIVKMKGFGGEFPEWYFDTIEKMIHVVMDTDFPDYTYPLFSDSRLVSKNAMLGNFKEFEKLFPDNKFIKYWASDRKEGEKPNYLSTAYKTGGFYIFRNGWDEKSSQMVVKAGPEGKWHNQPDNGTFELYINGRNFFRDSGSYVYGGDEETLQQRAWFKQTRVHNTLTLDNKNLNETKSKCLLWKTGPQEDILVTENQSYPDLKHRRSIFFVDQKYFVIVDEAIGEARGKVGIHYNMSEGEVKYDTDKLQVITQYSDNNNLQLQVFAPEGATMEQEEGWVSYQIRQKAKRPAFSVNSYKTDGTIMRFITVLSPLSDNKSGKIIKVKIVSEPTGNKLSLITNIGNKEYRLGYNISHINNRP